MVLSSDLMSWNEGVQSRSDEFDHCLNLYDVKVIEYCEKKQFIFFCYD